MKFQLPGFAVVLSECIKTQNLQLGRQLHSLFIKNGEKQPLLEYNYLSLFQNSLTRHGLNMESIYMFKRMQKVCRGNGLWLDEFTVVCLVNTCAGLGALKLLHQLQGVAVLTGLDFNVVVCNALIDAFGKCGAPDYSFKVFSGMKERDVVSWTSILVAYAHAGRLLDACRVFDEMPERNEVSWNALLAGYAKNGQVDRTLLLFARMEAEGFVSGAFTYVSVLSACADSALVEIGKQVHGRLCRSEHVNDFQNAFLINALVDFYCKCGDMKSAMKLFDRFLGKDVVSWNSMITGFAQNGQAELSIHLFNSMMKQDVKPNDLTFLGVLSACSHTGSVPEALRILNAMEDAGEVPNLDHYAILIDLLGRKNHLDEAFQLAKKLHNGSNHAGMWGALLHACRMHGNVVLGTKAAEALLNLEPGNSGRYVMLSNIYNAAGWWTEACRVRRHMDDKCLRKEVACSWIEVRNMRHEFVAKDKTHCQITQIEELFHKLSSHMKDAPLLEMLLV